MSAPANPTPAASGAPGTPPATPQAGTAGPPRELGTLGVMRALLQRDLRLALRRKADTLGAAFFFVIVVSLFPLGVGPEPELLRQMAAGTVWVAALLASMLAMPRLFADDAADGTLEQMLLGGTPLPLPVGRRWAPHCWSAACCWCRSRWVSATCCCICHWGWRRPTMAWPRCCLFHLST